VSERCTLQIPTNEARDTIFRDNGLRRLPSSGMLDGGLQIKIMKRFSLSVGPGRSDTATRPVRLYGSWTRAA
jgi:hypothetical protein